MLVGAARQRWPRSAGTATPVDVLRNRFRAPSPKATAADIAAVDRGEGRTVACLFRGSYGRYPRRFRQRVIDLTLGSVVLRPWWYSLHRKPIVIAEPISGAQVRPRAFKTDWNVRATGLYAEGQPLGYAGSVVIACQTPSGTLEFAVPRPDVQLVLHVLQRARSGPAGTV
jgi:hypothetical protein